jgi:hypothetical protein
MNRRDYVENGIQIDERNEENARRKKRLEGETPEDRQEFRYKRGNPDSGHRGVSGITTATNTRAGMYTAADRERANTRNLTKKTQKLKSSVSNFLKDRIRSRLQNNSYEPDYDEHERIYEAMESDEKHEMAETQLYFICYAAEEILEYVQMGGNIEEWYQNKLSKVHSDMEGLHSFVEGEKRRLGMEKED